MAARSQVRTRPGLDPDQIAAAALEVLDRKGIDGLTMRAVGDELGVSAMAIYHHVSDKQALLLAVQDAAIAERPLPATSGDGWEADLLAMARWMRDGLLAHPGLVAARSGARAWTHAVARVSERWLAIWQQSGLDFDAATRAAAICSAAIVGYVEQEVTDAVLPAPDDAVLVDYPNLRAAAERRARFDADASFDLLVCSLVAGIFQEDQP